MVEVWGRMAMHTGRFIAMHMAMIFGYYRDS